VARLLAVRAASGLFVRDEASSEMAKAALGPRVGAARIRRELGVVPLHPGLECEPVGRSAKSRTLADAGDIATSSHGGRGTLSRLPPRSQSGDHLRGRRVPHGRPRSDWRAAVRAAMVDLGGVHISRSRDPPIGCGRSSAGTQPPRRGPPRRVAGRRTARWATRTRSWPRASSHTGPCWSRRCCPTSPRSRCFGRRAT
jgi:hypothetical protein